MFSRRAWKDVARWMRSSPSFTRHDACMVRALSHLRAPQHAAALRPSALQQPTRDSYSLVQYAKRMLSGRDPYSLSTLRQHAAERPSDMHSQVSYLRELNNQGMHESVVQHYESMARRSEEAATEYSRALAQLRKMKNRRNVGTGRRRASTTGRYAPRLGRDAGRAAETGSSERAVLEGTAGSAREPIHVVMQEPGLRGQLWKLAKSVAYVYVLLLIVTAFMEDRGGLSRGLSRRTEIAPGEKTDIKFSDVRGCDEAKGELEEVVEYLRDPSRFTRLGGKLPKGLLLTGPPGTGKTLLAKAIAGEAEVPFFYCSGSEFEEMFVGVGARRVRDLFAAAKVKAPCIIFIDEIDAVGARRNPKDQQYMRMTLNQLLAEMDGFKPSEGIIVIGATNFPQSLDPALVRPGRFDRNVTVPLPDVKGRSEILSLHAGKVVLDKNVDLGTVARGTPGMSGADLANLVNIAAIRAAHKGRNAVHSEDFDFARDRILMGAERKSAVIEPENLEMTAYHESGHALVALYTKGARPIHKATIIPRGQALGMVQQLPDKDELSISREQLLAMLDVAMGGRVAEELIYGEEKVTTGASSDIAHATNLARSMVTKWGMSEKVGLVSAEDDIAPDTRRVIDEEVRRLVDEAYHRARSLLTARRGELKNLTTALLKYETLSGEQVRNAASGKLR